MYSFIDEVVSYFIHVLPFLFKWVSGVVETEICRIFTHGSRFTTYLVISFPVGTTRRTLNGKLLTSLRK